MKQHLSFYLCLCVVASGCVGIKEGTRGFLGVSTKALEERRAEAVRATSSLDTQTCFMTVHKILKKIGTHVYHIDQDKHFIAVYVSPSDTTPVGVFVSPHEGASLIEVSSRSSYAKELIAGKLFPELTE